MALCVWGGMAWCTPLGLEKPQPGPSAPLDVPVLSPERPLDRELFGREPGSIKAIVPSPGQPRPKAGPGQQPPKGLPEPAAAPLPTPPGLLPEVAEPSKPSVPPPAASAKDYSGVSEAENPLVDIARRMREAERLLAQADAGQRTQELQDGILRDLDELLKQVSARCRAAQACQGENPSQQTADRQGYSPEPQNPPQPVSELPKPRSKKGLGSVARTGERPTLGRKPPANGQQRSGLVRGAWGSLPERQRQQMMQLLPPEQFVPKYESLIEEYYRRLNEENGHARP